MGTVQLYFHCGHLVVWYMAGHPVVLKRNNTVPGLLIRRAVSRCTQLNERSHHFLRFSPLGNLISQHFIVLFMRDTTLKRTYSFPQLP